MICPFCNQLHERRKWCSNQCKFEYYKKQKRISNNLKNDLIKISCKQCDVLFKPRKREDEVFCSDNCKIEYHKNNSKNRTAKERQLTIKLCPICLNKFNPNKTMKQKYCSRRCCYLFSKKAYKALQTCLKQIGGKKEQRTFETLGYTPSELINHIHQHSNWNKIKDEDWHLDHIFPIKAFLDHNIKDIKIICCLENLQPLLAKENLKKNDRYEVDAFKAWIFLKKL